DSALERIGAFELVIHNVDLIEAMPRAVDDPALVVLLSEDMIAAAHFTQTVLRSGVRHPERVIAIVARTCEWRSVADLERFEVLPREGPGLAERDDEAVSREVALAVEAIVRRLRPAAPPSA